MIREDELGAECDTKAGRGSDCTHTGADPQQSSRRSRVGSVLARSTQHLFYFKHEQHCLLASSMSSEIQNLMDYAGQKRDLPHIKSHLQQALGP